MDSLLAHLYSRIKGSPEDVATMSAFAIFLRIQNLLHRRFAGIYHQ